MRDGIEAALALSRGIIEDGSELVPRFMIATDEGEVTIHVQLPDDMAERNYRMSLVHAYMKVKLARSFVMASELSEPDASMAVAVSREGCIAGLQIITRKPLSLGAVQWLDRDQIGDEIPSMLPQKFGAVSAAEIAEVERLIAYNEGLELG